MQRHPRATYRVQLHPGFTFRHAAGAVDYLAGLGISHLYTSPFLQAAPGSTHGYDVVDFTAVSAELGGEEGRRELCAALAGRGMGQVVDLVPNHMAASVPHNRWWTHTLTRGRRGKYAKFFDVDWRPPGARIRNRVLLPVLGGHYGREMERGHIRLVRRRDGVYVQYFEHLFPVSPGSLRRLEETAGGEKSRASRAGALDAALEELNRDQEALDAFLERQHYRLCSWRASGTVLGYRRFFDINSMVALRMAEPEVFREAHRLALQWVRDGEVQGLRVDHPDGLRDPAGYFRALRREAPRAWIVAEKILLPGERLPGSWQVQGTTGYEFLNLTGGLFVDPAGERALGACYRRFSGEARDFREVLRDAKRQVVREVLGGGLNRLTALLSRTCERHPVARDFTPDQLRDALRELATCLPVYRTYIDAEQGLISSEDARLVERAAGEAAAGPVEPEVLEYIRDLLLLRRTGPDEAEFVMRFQQFTGPAMAKGGEDTALYRYHRLTALNEVGGDPGRFGASPEEFHASMAERAGTQPSAMLASSTHDTKRSEDVQARLALLSEIPRAWEEAVFR
jgi:(1->4)-alpha-D-glucan 1-alpha-D-glucosylmutase